MKIPLLRLNTVFRIANLKLHVIFPKQKAQSVYFGDSICYQFNPKIEIESERIIEETLKQANFEVVMGMQQTVNLLCNS